MHHLKRITLLVLILFIFSSSWLFSRIVTRTDVEKAITHWIELENSLTHLRLNKSAIQISAIRELMYRNTLVGYIVDLEPSGFILVPAVSELSPVKFISFSGDYDGNEKHPFIETLKYRLYFTVTNLGYFRGEILRTSDLVPSKMDTNQKEKNEAAWEKLLREDFLPVPYLYAVYTNSVNPMLTSRWSQKYPYNASCPELGGNPCVTGCIATAQAQVMYYWKYPATGQGVNSYYWSIGEKYLSADFNHEYSWDRMFDSYTGSESQEQIDAVARLMFDVGLARNMNYGLSGSFTAPNRNNSLVTFFKYSQDLRYVNWAHYSSWADWFNVFKDQMEHGWPVLLAILGQVSGNSHFVVLDGYRIEGGINQVHVNMGWGGLADNYYSIDDIYGMGNCERDSALINIYPPDCTNTGNISGIVTDKIGNPLKEVHVKIYDQDESHVKSAWTDSMGNFVASCMKEGTYRIFFDAGQAGFYESEWYNDRDSFDAADAVSVTVGGSTTGVDAVLSETGGINGRVSESSGTGIPDVHVCAFYLTGDYAGCWRTDSNGDYELSHLKAGSYKIRFDPSYTPGMYASEWYNDKDSEEDADLISVSPGSFTSEIDAVLEKGGNITGQVKNSAGVGIDDDVLIRVYTPSGGLLKDQWIDIYGNYEVKTLKKGSYKIYFDASGTQGNYVSKWYDDKGSLEDADLVKVTKEHTTTGIDGVLISTTPVYAPLNFKGQKVENRSLMLIEYINVLTWQANPENENILKYRIYQMEGESRSLLEELNAQTFDKTYECWHRRVDKDKAYSYVLVAVDVDGREGTPTYLTVQ